jgi:catechol 2,3-dioxygenase-like lactoylglutathione lyase family enzyme
VTDTPTPALGTTTITQIGLVVRDIEARARDWSRILGLPEPQIIVTDTYEKARTEFRGEPSQARAKLAFFRMGQVQVELIEPTGEASTWREELEKRGDSLHHIAFQIEGMGEKLAYLEGQGVSLVQKGEYTGGRYAYVDAMGPLGTIIELLEND